MIPAYEEITIGICEHCGTRGVGLVGPVDGRLACACCARSAGAVLAPEELAEDTTESYLRARPEASQSDAYQEAMREIERGAFLRGFRRLLLGRR